jgi:hypothetical protein
MLHNGKPPPRQPSGKVTIYAGPLRVVITAGAPPVSTAGTVVYPRHRAANGQFRAAPRTILSAEEALVDAEFEEFDNGA